MPQPRSGTHHATINAYVGAALVFGSSAAVLVIELVALRLLAPYLGLTLETSTFVIGTALTAIALGSWMGGQTADRVSPHHMLAPLLAISGVVVGFTPSSCAGWGRVRPGPRAVGCCSWRCSPCWSPGPPSRPSPLR